MIVIGLWMLASKTVLILACREDLKNSTQEKLSTENQIVQKNSLFFGST